MNVPKFFIHNFEITAMTKIWSGRVTPYHTLFSRLERKPFYIGNFKISSQALDFS